MTLTHTMDRAASRAIRAYDRLVLRSRFASLFWVAIVERRKRSKYPLSELAKALGKNKGEVSRWFSSEAPNWTLATIAEVAYALDLEIKVEAKERATGTILTESGPKRMPSVYAGQIAVPPVTSRGLPQDSGGNQMRVKLSRYSVSGVRA